MAYWYMATTTHTHAFTPMDSLDSLIILTACLQTVKDNTQAQTESVNPNKKGPDQAKPET